MKSRCILALFVLGVTLLAITAAAQATFTVVTATMVHTNLIEGVVTCQIGSPSGIPLYPCGPGGKGTIRGRLAPALTTAADPRLHSTDEVVANINFGRDGKGQMWGTYVSHVAGGGTIEGTYSGTIEMLTLAYELKSVGHGSGGIVDGLQFKTDFLSSGGVYPNFPPTQLITRVLNPGGKH